MRPSRLSLLLLAGAILATGPLVAQSNMPGEPQPSNTKASGGANAAKDQKFEPQAQASSFGGTVVEDVVARVNDQIITRSDYNRALQQLVQDSRQQGWSDPDLADRKRDLLRDLVDQQLLLSKGKELGITGETELVKRLDEIRKQNHLETMEDLEKAATQQGVSYEDFKQNIRNGIITQEVIRNEVGRRIQLSRADVQRFYDAHQAEFSQPESEHLSEILIPVPTGSDPAADLQTAQAKANDLEAKLKAGASFEDLAKANSTGSTAAQGGDLGEFKRGMLAKELEDKTFALDAGQVTEPTRTKQGYIILKVTQHIKGGTPDLKTVGPQVEEAAFMNRMQPALRDYLNQLRQQAYIDYKPGFVDSAAAADSVRPLYSAYTPPPAKKKAKVQRTRYRPSRSYRNKSKSDAAENSTAPTIASTGGTEKPGRKEKIRFGQAPRQTLAATPATAPAATPGTAPADAAQAPGVAADGSNGAPANGESQVARSVAPDITSSADQTTAAPEKKTRFSDRAKQPKPKKVKTRDQIENANVEKVTADELAAQKTQSAPLGLAGNTAQPKKQPKVKSDKTRFADQEKDKKAKENAAPPAPAPSTPSPLATPATAAPATAPPADQPAAAPADQPPTQPAPVTPSPDQTAPAPQP